jgi:dipeptidase
MKKLFLSVITVVGLAILIPTPQAMACTNFLITRGASIDGSTMISYAADSHDLYGELYFTKAGTHREGEMVEIYDWDSGKHLGQIKQVAQTYSVVGNINEHQVAIGETTFGGRKELRNREGIVDYGSLMYLALARAKTAREAIDVMTSLVAEYGYQSSGESFSISDPNEVWIMEMVGRGAKNRGAVWVARKIPDGYISAHANQARIRRFPLDDPENTLYSKDVITFARKKGYFKGADKDFSFADTYAPLDFGALRICEARVWSMFRRVSSSCTKYLDYAMGVDGAEPMPLWIKPERKLSSRDVMELMRDHFEDSPMDLTKGVGAGPFKLPYRWRPLVWEHKGQKYFNERSTSTQQTGFSFVAQSRAWLPDPIGGILWFGVDDTYSSVYVPIYCSVREAPHAFAVGTADFNRFSWDSAFWVFNFVSNFTYLRYDLMIEEVKLVQRKLESYFESMRPEVDAAATALYKQSPELARDYLNDYSKQQTARTVDQYRELLTRLLVKFMDGNVRDEKGEVTHPRYSDEWYEQIVKQRPEFHKVKPLKQELEREKKTKTRCHNLPGTIGLPPVCFVP